MAIDIAALHMFIKQSGMAPPSDPGTQAMAAAATAARPPGGAPLPQFVQPQEQEPAEEDPNQPTAEDIAEKEKEIQDLRGKIQHEQLEREKVEAKAEIERAQQAASIKLKQQEASLKASQQAYAAEATRQKASVGEEAAKKKVELAEQKAKALMTIADMNARNYVKTTDDARKKADEYAKYRSQQLADSTPSVSAALQNQMSGAIATMSRVGKQQSKARATIPMPGVPPVRKQAAALNTSEQEFNLPRRDRDRQLKQSRDSWERGIMPDSQSVHGAQRATNIPRPGTTPQRTAGTSPQTLPAPQKPTATRMPANASNDEYTRAVEAAKEETGRAALMREYTKRIHPSMRAMGYAVEGAKLDREMRGLRDKYLRAGMTVPQDVLNRIDLLEKVQDEVYRNQSKAITDLRARAARGDQKAREEALEFDNAHISRKQYGAQGWDPVFVGDKMDAVAGRNDARAFGTKSTLGRWANNTADFISAGTISDLANRRQSNQQSADYAARLGGEVGFNGFEGPAGNRQLYNRLVHNSGGDTSKLDMMGSAAIPAVVGGINTGASVSGLGSLARWGGAKLAGEGVRQAARRGWMQNTWNTLKSPDVASPIVANVGYGALTDVPHTRRSAMQSQRGDAFNTRNRWEPEEVRDFRRQGAHGLEKNSSYFQKLASSRAIDLNQGSMQDNFQTSSFTNPYGGTIGYIMQLASPFIQSLTGGAVQLVKNYQPPRTKPPVTDPQLLNAHMNSYRQDSRFGKKKYPTNAIEAMYQSHAAGNTGVRDTTTYNQPPATAYTSAPSSAGQNKWLA